MDTIRGLRRTRCTIHVCPVYNCTPCIQLYTLYITVYPVYNYAGQTRVLDLITLWYLLGKYMAFGRRTCARVHFEESEGSADQSPAEGLRGIRGAPPTLLASHDGPFNFVVLILGLLVQDYFSVRNFGM